MTGSRGHCRLVDRGEEGTSAGGAATEGTQAAEGAELAWRSMRRSHVSDDDSQRQAVKSNDFLCAGQLKLTATVCPQRRAVYRSAGMECHDTMSRLDMEWSMRSIPTNKVSTGKAETMSAMEKLRDRRDSVQEGTMKQRNVKAWKATQFRSETESLQQVENKNRSRCANMSALTGRGSLEDSVSGEDWLRIEQLDYFEKVFVNSMAAVGRAT